MNLKKINYLIDLYCLELSNGNDPDKNLWIGVERFQKNWDLDAKGISEMINESIDLSFSLWDRKDFHPIDSMLRYTAINQEMVRSIFLDLFNENKEIVARIDRFVFHCREFEMLDRRNDLKAPSNYHADKKCIFAYLCFMYPETYGLYNFALFSSFMNYVGVANMPDKEDIDRFVKVNKTVRSLLLRHERFNEIMNKDFIFNKYLMLHVFEIFYISSVQE